jgi:hypothetical protein
MRSLTRAELLERNKKRNGGKPRCWICKELIDGTKPGTWVKEHKDNNPKNNKSDNLDIAHRRCNYHKNPPKFYNLKGKSFNSEGEWERVREKLKAQSAEFEKGSESKPKFIKWLYKEMLIHGSLYVEDIRYSGSKVCGAGPDTVYERYLKPECSRVSVLMFDTRTHNDGKEARIVVWRKGGRERFIKSKYGKLFRKYCG